MADRKPPGHIWATQLAESLTAKELAVLRLVAQDLDNRSIAAELGVGMVNEKLI